MILNGILLLVHEFETQPNHPKTSQLNSCLICQIQHPENLNGYFSNSFVLTKESLRKCLNATKVMQVMCGFSGVLGIILDNGYGAYSLIVACI